MRLLLILSLLVTGCSLEDDYLKHNPVSEFITRTQHYSNIKPLIVRKFDDINNVSLEQKHILDRGIYLKITGIIYFSQDGKQYKCPFTVHYKDGEYEIKSIIKQRKL